MNKNWKRLNIIYKHFSKSWKRRSKGRRKCGFVYCRKRVRCKRWSNTTLRWRSKKHMIRHNVNCTKSIRKSSKPFKRLSKILTLNNNLMVMTKKLTTVQQTRPSFHSKTKIWKTWKPPCSKKMCSKVFKKSHQNSRPKRTNRQ